MYPLDEVLLLSLLGVLAGADSFAGIARFGEKKLRLLRRFLPFADGTPPHDTLGDIFATLESRGVSALLRRLGRRADQDASRSHRHRRQDRARSGANSKSKAPIHMVSAFAARQRLVLAQTKVSEKSNEIVAIPALLDMMAIEETVVTIDAMGCQRDIAARIIAKKADYILALKSNQGSLREDVRDNRQRAENQGLRRFPDLLPRNHRRRSRSPRDAKIHGLSQRRMAAGAAQWARFEGRHHGREPTRVP